MRPAAELGRCKIFHCNNPTLPASVLVTTQIDPNENGRSTLHTLGTGPMQPNLHHDQSEPIIKASQAEVFAYHGDQTRLASHLEKRSMMMLGEPHDL